MKKVVSVSLGSSKRDFSTTANYLGQDFEISRIGTDGNWKAYQQKLLELDGKVDAIGLGGLDLYLVAGGKRYAFRDVQKMVSAVTQTPVVDGSGLKNTLERNSVRYLRESGLVDFRKSKTLVVCAVDRFGLAEEIAASGGKAIYGDLMFNLGLPVPVRRFGLVRILAAAILPVVVRLPFQWVYPTGDKQEKITPKFGWVYRWADIITGDFHIIRRFLPAQSGSLAGKTVITNTTTKEDQEILKDRGVHRLITTTQSFGGRTSGTNVLEAVLVAAIGCRPDDLSEQDYTRILKELNWTPCIINLQNDAE